MTASALDQAAIDAARRRHPRVFGRPAGQRLLLTAGWLAFAALVVFGLWRTQFFDLPRLVAGIDKLGLMFRLMFPPAHNGWLMDFLEGIAETLGMAFLGTLMAAVVAVPLGFLGARNVVPSRLFNFGIRRGFDTLRGIDQLIWALVFINVVGLGPFAGILAIFVSDTGTFSKLFSEAIENVERGQREGVKSAGAGPLVEARYGILPQVLPVMVSQALYYFESNTRSATILGVVGAGGIGLHLSDRIRANNWDEACFIILMILATVMIIDFLSRAVRTRLIGGAQMTRAQLDAEALA